MKTGSINQLQHSARWIKTGLSYVIWLLVLIAAFALIWLWQNKPSTQDKKFNGAKFVCAQPYTEEGLDPFTDAYLPAVQSQHHI
jgi:hypothetical protein